MNKPFNVLISCLLFRGLTGSEMYVYELSKGLTRLGCNVTISSPHVSSKMIDLAASNGVDVIDMNRPMDFDQFDIIHCQHKPIVDFLIQKAPHIKKICTIHSEVMSHNLEDPVKHDSIKHYITIRPEIKTHIVKKFQIDESTVSVIYNPVDQEKFKPKEVKQHDAVLFVGTLDYLRKQMLFDLVDYTRDSNKLLWLVGDNNDSYLPELLKYDHVKHSPSVRDIEEYTQRCSETAGILLGRTTIEGWMCGKSGWIYGIDSLGNVLSKELFTPPLDLQKFYANNVANQIKDIYIGIYNS